MKILKFISMIILGVITAALVLIFVFGSYLVLEQYWNNWRNKEYRVAYSDGVRWAMEQRAVEGVSLQIEKGLVMIDGHQTFGVSFGSKIYLKKGDKTLVYDALSREWSFGFGWEGYKIFGYSSLEGEILVCHFNKEERRETFFKIRLDKDEGFVLESAK